MPNMPTIEYNKTYVVNGIYFSMDGAEKTRNFGMPVYEETITKTKEGDCYTRKYLRDHSIDMGWQFKNGDIATYLKKSKWGYDLHSFGDSPCVKYANGSWHYLKNGREVVGKPWSICYNGQVELLVSKPNSLKPGEFYNTSVYYKLGAGYTTNNVIMLCDFGYYEHETGAFKKAHGNEPCFVDFEYREISNKALREMVLGDSRNYYKMVPIVLLSGKKAWIHHSGIIW